MARWEFHSKNKRKRAEDGKEVPDPKEWHEFYHEEWIQAVEEAYLNKEEKVTSEPWDEDVDGQRVLVKWIADLDTGTQWRLHSADGTRWRRIFSRKIRRNNDNGAVWPERGDDEIMISPAPEE